MIKFEVKPVLTKNNNEVISVAEFNENYSHIIADDNCWVIMNGGQFSSWIFAEAMKVLKKLPTQPLNYKPYKKYLGIK